MNEQPVLFVSHGSPMLPLEPGTAAPMLAALGRELPPPAAILAFSPHWMGSSPAIGASSLPATLHDFGGFDPRLNGIRYAASGSPDLARRVAGLLHAAGWPARLDPDRGLDHGIWVPLALMFPAAQIPVVPLSMPWPLDAARAYRIGASLRPLASEGVLLLGTGSLTHNLRDFHPSATTDDPPLAYVQDFVTWMRQAIERGDRTTLLDYRRLAPHAARAHPTDEHLLPLFWALGAAGTCARPRCLSGGVHYGMLSMDAWMFPCDPG